MLIMDDRFAVEVISQTPNPQQIAYAAMHQDYAEELVWTERDRWPEETKCGELIVKYLLKGNRGHYGPLEHPQIVLNFGFFPHSTMQQMRTHRNVSFDVQCLAGDTEITFIDGKGYTNRTLKKTIGELYDLWTNGETAIRERQIRGRQGQPPCPYQRDCKTRLRKMRLRVLNEDTGRFEIGHIKDVMCSGLQPVYRLTLANGQTLDCTTQHRLLTSEGWQTMGDAVGLVTDPEGHVVEMTKPSAVMCNGLTAAGNGLYRDKTWLQQQINAGFSTKAIAELSGCSDEERELIGAWTRQIAPQVHQKFNYTCQRCAQRGGALQAHHLVPVFADGCLAYDFENLVSLCKSCHEYIHHNHCEMEFAQNFQPLTQPAEWQPKPKALTAHPVQVIKVDYLGTQVTYDLEVEGPWHNFVANGMVVHNSFRYTGQRIQDVVEGKQDLEDVFYLRPVGTYTDRQGKKYEYTTEQRQQDLDWCLQGCHRYAERIGQGLSEEHARGLIPFDVRQHWVMSANARSLMHLLDIRGKFDVQAETRVMTELMFERFQQWMPDVAAWYEKTRWRKGPLAP